MDLRLGDKKKAEYSKVWDRLIEWCHNKGITELTSWALNDYIARVCTQYSSDWLARNTRASAVWVAEVWGAELPCDRITWKLVEGLRRSSKLGVARVLTAVQARSGFWCWA